MYSKDMVQKLPKHSDSEKKDEAVLQGKIIQEYLENVNLDAWYYIYQVYVNPLELEK